MARWTPLLANLNELNPLNTSAGPVPRSAALHVRDIVLIVATGLLLAALLVIWAKYLRKTSRRKSDPHSRSRVADEEPDEAADNPESAQRKHRRRRRRREHRPRNPTLSETGGLPPARVEPNPPLPE